MPIYAYRCETCGHAKDVLQKMSDDPLEICPACGAATFRKQVTAAGFQLKGSGWYVTDFRNPAGAKAGSAGEGAEKAPEKAAPGGAADKPAEKVGDKPAATAAPSAAPSPAPAASSPPPSSGS